MLKLLIDWNQFERHKLNIFSNPFNDPHHNEHWNICVSKQYIYFGIKGMRRYSQNLHAKLIQICYIYKYERHGHKTADTGHSNFNEHVYFCNGLPWNIYWWGWNVHEKIIKHFTIVNGHPVKKYNKLWHKWNEDEWEWEEETEKGLIVMGFSSNRTFGQSRLRLLKIISIWCTIFNGLRYTDILCVSFGTFSVWSLITVGLLEWKWISLVSDLYNLYMCTLKFYRSVRHFCICIFWVNGNSCHIFWFIHRSNDTLLTTSFV